MQTNFTLPLLLAGGAAVKWSLDNERAMTKVAKVYGDGTQSAQAMKNELAALDKAFVQLSERFGVNQAAVKEVAAGWAAAGATGVALARSTETTLRTMILGDMDAVKATEALISIQAQYSLSSKQLSDVVAQLNIIENQTGVSLSGLVEGYARAAGVARSAGVDTRHLGAMIAALSPAAGSAAQAGNALKTIFSRLLSPTRDAVDLLKLMGINVADLGWKSLNATQRLEIMAKKFDELSDAQKAVVSATLASRYQINKFDVLMREINSNTGFYQKALDATSDRTRYLRVAQQELNQVFNSSPQKLKIIWTMLQNAMASVIQPLIPLILAIATSLKNAVEWFNRLDPSVQKLVLALLVFLALVGPVVRYIGAFATLLGFLEIAFTGVFKMIAPLFTLARALIVMPLSAAASGISALGAAGWAASKGLWAAAIASVAFLRSLTWTATVAAARSIMWIFYGSLLVAGQGIVFLAQKVLLIGPAMRLLGQALMFGVGRALLFASVLTKLPAAMAAFGRSLLGAVALMRTFGPALLRALVSPIGIAVIAAITVAYTFRDRIKGWVNDIIGLWYKLPAGITGAIKATIHVIAEAAKQIYEWLSYLNPFAHHSPSLVEEVIRGMKIIKDEFGRLKVVSAPLDAARAKLVQLRAQQQVVLNWKNAVDAASKALDIQQAKLQKLQDVASRINDSLSAARDRMEAFANTPIQGMKAMEDQIFANDQAQKALQLQMMKMEDIVGPIDKLQNKMGALNGQIELLRGQQADLRAAGAGSDILSVFDQQIGSLQGQSGGIQGQIAVLQDMQDAIDKLQRTAAELDLEKSLKFDDLVRQIDDAAHSMKELPFSQIIAGVKANRLQVDQLQVAYNAANAAVAAQQQIVDAAQAAHDKLADSYDREKAKLDQMTLSYNRFNDAIVQAQKALTASGVKKGVAAPDSAAVAAFKAGAGGEFPDVSGAGAQLGREMPNIQDQSALIDQYTQDIAKQTGDMFAKFDMFRPIREGWSKSMNWIKNNVGPVVGGIMNAFRGATSDSGSFFDTVKEKAAPAITLFRNVGQTIWKALGIVWQLIGPEVKKTVGIIIKFAKQLWSSLGPQFQKLATLFGPLIEAIGHLWNLMKPFVGFLLVVFLGALKILWSTINGAIGPVFVAFAKILGNIAQVVINVVKLILDIINGDWKKAWHDAQQIVAGTFAAIGNLIKGAWNMIVGIVKGFVMGIVHFFEWLWDQLVGHSIIPDMINAIIMWFVKLPIEILKAIGTLVRNIAAWAWNVMTSAWNTMKSVWNSIYAWVTGLPGRFVSGLASLGGKLADVAKAAFDRFLSGAKSIIDGGKGFIAWLGGIPARAGQALGKLGSIVADAIKGAWNGAANWLNKWIIGNINKVTGLFGLNIPNLPTFAKGGVIPGAVSPKDNVLIAARTGEGILVPEAVKGLGGAQGINDINRMFANRNGSRAWGAVQGQKGSVQHFADGGIVGAAESVGSWIKNHFEEWMKKGAGFVVDNLLRPVGGAIRAIMPNGFAEDWLVGIIEKWRESARSWGQQKDVSLGGAITGNFGLDKVVGAQNFIKSQEGKPYVWGATGPGSYDCSGLASAVYGVLTGKGGGNGQRYFTTSTIGAAQGFRPGTGMFSIGDDRGSHMAGSLVGLKFEATPPYVRVGSSAKDVHSFPEQWTLDRGGIIPPGLTTILNGTGRPEAVLTHTQWSAIMGAERAFAAFTTGMLKGGSGSILAAANARARAGSNRASGSTFASSGRGDLTVHIHGDLSFPNIDNHSSAHDFLDNLETIARP